jgi:hypothetical protein
MSAGSSGNSVNDSDDDWDGSVSSEEVDEHDVDNAPIETETTMEEELIDLTHLPVTEPGDNAATLTEQAVVFDEQIDAVRALTTRCIVEMYKFKDVNNFKSRYSNVIKEWIREAVVLAYETPDDEHTVHHVYKYEPTDEEFHIHQEYWIVLAEEVRIAKIVSACLNQLEDSLLKMERTKPPGAEVPYGLWNKYDEMEDDFELRSYDALRFVDAKDMQEEAQSLQEHFQEQYDDYVENLKNIAEAARNELAKQHRINRWKRTEPLRDRFAARVDEISTKLKGLVPDNPSMSDVDGGHAYDYYNQLKSELANLTQFKKGKDDSKDDYLDLATFDYPWYARFLKWRSQFPESTFKKIMVGEYPGIYGLYDKQDEELEQQMFENHNDPEAFMGRVNGVDLTDNFGGDSFELGPEFSDDPQEVYQIKRWYEQWELTKLRRMVNADRRAAAKQLRRETLGNDKPSGAGKSKDGSERSGSRSPERPKPPQRPKPQKNSIPTVIPTRPLQSFADKLFAPSKMNPHTPAHTPAYTPAHTPKYTPEHISRGNTSSGNTSSRRTPSRIIRYQPGVGAVQTAQTGTNPTVEERFNNDLVDLRRFRMLPEIEGIKTGTKSKYTIEYFKGKVTDKKQELHDYEDELERVRELSHDGGISSTIYEECVKKFSDIHAAMEKKTKEIQKYVMGRREAEVQVENDRNRRIELERLIDQSRVLVQNLYDLSQMSGGTELQYKEIETMRTEHMQSGRINRDRLKAACEIEKDREKKRTLDLKEEAIRQEHKARKK